MMKCLAVRRSGLLWSTYRRTVTAVILVICSLFRERALQSTEKCRKIGLDVPAFRTVECVLEIYGAKSQRFGMLMISLSAQGRERWTGIRPLTLKTLKSDSSKHGVKRFRHSGSMRWTEMVLSSASATVK